MKFGVEQSKQEVTKIVFIVKYGGKCTRLDIPEFDGKKMSEMIWYNF